MIPAAYPAIRALCENREPTITSTRTASDGATIQLATHRHETAPAGWPGVATVAARVNNGPWQHVSVIKPVSHPSGVVIGGKVGTYAIRKDELNQAHAARAAMPEHMGELIARRKGLLGDAAMAGGALSAAMSKGDAAEYGAAGAADKASREKAAATLADFDAANPHVAAEMSRRADAAKPVGWYQH